jgi:alanine racemase
MATVKANAYGHGAVEVSKRLERLGVRYLAVFTIEEGIELRKAGIKQIFSFIQN